MRKWLFLILALAFLLRIWGITFLPPWGDEINFIETSFAIGYGKANPGFAHGGFLYYFLFLIFGFFYILGKICGIFHAPVDILRYYVTNPLFFLLVGRFATVLVSLVAIYLTYLLGKRLHSQKAGLFASLFMAVSYIMVQQAHYIKADIYMGTFVLLSALFAERILKSEENTKYYLLSGFFAGMAAAAKIYAVVSILFLISSHLAINKYKIGKCIRDKKLWLAFGLSLFGFTLWQPYTWPNLRSFISFMFLIKDVPKGVLGDLNKADPWYFLFTEHLKDGIGLPLFLLSGITLLFFIVKYRKYSKLLVFIMPFLIIGIIVIATSFFENYYWVWLLPFLFILCGIFLSETLTAISGSRLKHLVALCGIAMVIPTSIDSMRLNIIFSSEDTRLLSKRWIENNIQEDAVLLVEGVFYCNRLCFSPQLQSSLNTLYREREEIIKKGGSGKLMDVVIEQALKDSTSRRFEMIKTRVLQSKMLTKEIDYVITSSEGEICRREKDFFKDGYVDIILSKEFKLVKEFVPFPSFRRDYRHMMGFNELRQIGIYNFKEVIAGPTIRVYKHRD